MFSKNNFDYIVIGGGSAGCVLANRLSENPDIQVLLIEAGGLDKNFLFHWPAGFAKMTKGIASWSWSTVAQKYMQNRQLWFTQARVLGGGSTINAQLYNRGNALDYDLWAKEYGCDGWSYKEVLPYFIRSENNDRFNNVYHGISGPLGVSVPHGALPICDAFIRSAQEYGIPYNHDFNGQKQAGVGYYQLSQLDRRRSSTATAYLRVAESRKNLHVYLDTMVHKILIEHGRAVGVEYSQAKQKNFAKADCEVIVTSGAIGSPKLLMLSGIGCSKHLNSVGIKVTNELSRVGNNLQDHIDICTIYECTGRHTYDGIERLDRTIIAGLQYMIFKSGPVTSSLFETGGFWYTDDEARSPDIQFHLGQGSGIEKGIVKLDKAGVTLNSAYMHPRSRGTVRLASSDSNDAPLIDPNYWQEPEDLKKSLRGLAMSRDILQQPAMSEFVSKEVLPGKHIKTDKDLFDYACKFAKTDHHPVGTCKMGKGDDAVVNNQLQVYGIENLRVCDASIMPIINSSNTNAPTIMIAEKAADLILGNSPLPSAKFPDDLVPLTGT